MKMKKGFLIRDSKKGESSTNIGNGTSDVETHTSTNCWGNERKLGISPYDIDKNENGWCRYARKGLSWGNVSHARNNCTTDEFDNSPFESKTDLERVPRLLKTRPFLPKSIYGSPKNALNS